MNLLGQLQAGTVSRIRRKWLSASLVADEY